MLRQDRFELSALDRPVVVDGGLMFEGIAARVHTPLDPLEYPTGPEYRRADELQRVVQQLATGAVPVTMPHGGRVVGKVTRAWFDDGRAAVRMVITDREAIDAVKNHTSKELSIGYSTDVVDGYQTNIKLVELSIVEAARCGSTCSIKTDHAPAQKGYAMDPQLELALKLINIRTDGLDNRGTALAILRSVGTNVDGPCSDADPTPIVKADDVYLVGRAYWAAKFAADRIAQRADAAAFATVKATMNVQRTDCGCTGSKPSPHVDGDLEREARERNARQSRLAWARGTEHADEAEAIEAIKTRTYQPIMRPAPRRGDSAPTDELAARQAMLASSRAAYLQPSADPLATEKE